MFAGLMKPCTYDTPFCIVHYSVSQQRGPNQPCSPLIEAHLLPWTAWAIIEYPEKLTFTSLGGFCYASLDLSGDCHARFE